MDAFLRRFLSPLPAGCPRHAHPKPNHDQKKHKSDRDETPIWPDFGEPQLPVRSGGNGGSIPHRQRENSHFQSACFLSPGGTCTGTSRIKLNRTTTVLLNRLTICIARFPPSHRTVQTPSWWKELV